MQNMKVVIQGKLLARDGFFKRLKKLLMADIYVVIYVEN